MQRDVGRAELLDAFYADMQSRSSSWPRLIAADPWIVSSLLQKSIRRSETEIAQRAALTLHSQRGSAIWRRLVVIAFEDVGIGSIDAVLTTVAVASDTAWRKSHGGDPLLAVHIADALAGAPKDRSADHLAGAKDHPGLAVNTKAMAAASKEARLTLVREKTAPLLERAVAAVLSCGLTSVTKGQAVRGCIDTLLVAFREMGVPEELVAATGIAAAKTREPTTLMVPLIWLAAGGARNTKVRDCSIPPRACANGVPLYALDEHTRLGREAIWRFARENDHVRACLERFVPEGQRRRAANVAAFYADAAPVARRLVWDQSAPLKAFGIERDLLLAGVPLAGIEALLEAVRANLGRLNEVRVEVLSRSRRRASTGPDRAHRP